MSLPKSIRLDDKLETKIKEYLKKNKIKFSQLINMALEKFISTPQTITLIPANTDEFLEEAETAYEENKDAMDKLK